LSIFITNLMHKFFILIYLLHFSTCFEHYCAHLRDDSHISTASGTITLFRWPVQYTGYERTHLACVLNSYLKRVTLPDAVLIQFVLPKMSITVLETCRGV
jgi:hypothetical protein